MPLPKHPAHGQTKESAAQRIALFIEAYLSNGGNATQAAITAGYSAKTAAQQASRLLRNVQVRTALDARRGTVMESAKLTTEAVLNQLRQTLFFDPRKLVREDGSPKSLHELDDDTAQALTGLEIEEIYDGTGKDRVYVGNLKKFKWLDKNVARDQANKILGAYEKDNLQAKEKVKVLVMPGGKDAPI